MSDKLPPAAKMPTFGSASVRLLPQQDIFALLLRQARGPDEALRHANENTTDKRSPAA